MKRIQHLPTQLMDELTIIEDYSQYRKPFRAIPRQDKAAFIKTEREDFPHEAKEAQKKEVRYYFWNLLGEGGAASVYQAEL